MLRYGTITIITIDCRSGIFTRVSWFRIHLTHDFITLGTDHKAYCLGEIFLIFFKRDRGSWKAWNPVWGSYIFFALKKQTSKFCILPSFSLWLTPLRKKNTTVKSFLLKELIISWQVLVKHRIQHQRYDVLICKIVKVYINLSLLSWKQQNQKTKHYLQPLTSLK